MFSVPNVPRTAICGLFCGTACVLFLSQALFASSEPLIQDGVSFDMELVSVEVDGVPQTDLSSYQEARSTSVHSLDSMGYEFVVSTQRSDDFPEYVRLRFTRMEGE